MSTVKVAINGFGRIGRHAFKFLFNTPGVEVVAINDLTDNATLAHLLKYDTSQGRFNAEVTSSEGAITVNGEEIKLDLIATSAGVKVLGMAKAVVIKK